MKFFVPQILELYWSKPVYKLSVRIIDFHPSVWFYKKFDFIVFNSEIAFWAWNWVYTVLGIALVRRKNILEHPLWLFLSPFRLGVLILVWRPLISKVKFQYRPLVFSDSRENCLIEPKIESELFDCQPFSKSFVYPVLKRLNRIDLEALFSDLFINQEIAVCWGTNTRKRSPRGSLLPFYLICSYCREWYPDSSID